jgi:2-oxoglutarate/2-oxoacid ferredoxin oxidoreductase subunit alpha
MDTPNTDTSSVREELDSVVIRFAGDSGDGMQITGSQFSTATALMGNDLSTFPDFPAEIRAPAGTTYGVSGFQIHFASHDIKTPGDDPDVLVAMNPAALRVNLSSLKRGGLLIVNSGAFNKANLEKAGYEVDPLTDGTLDGYKLLTIDITKLTLDAVKPFKLGAKDAGRCKNMWTLGLMYWLYGRERQPSIDFLNAKFGKKRPELAEANIAALNAGHIYGETAELPTDITPARVPRAELAPGTYRTIDGNQALAWGFAAAAQLSGLTFLYGSYPITPASTLLHHLARLKHFGVTTFQAEDEIAAIASAIGASFAGSLGITGTSGPGVALKGEAIGLAIMTELPLVVVDVQRGGPSTGLPTKTEQSDLFQAVWGRNGDAPLPVIAPATPGECFDFAILAARIATKYMTPVILLTDGFTANSVEPWRIPDVSKLEPIDAKHHTDPEGFSPFKRDPDTLARVWAKPGTPGLEHRIGGIEKDAASGHISYDPANHHKMTLLRAQKVQNVRQILPPATLEQGESQGDLLVIGWGSTHGAISQAVERVRKQGKRVSHLHLRHIWPLPEGLKELCNRFDQVMVPELNNGQLARLLRAELLVDAQSFPKIAGQPFKIREIVEEIDNRLAQKEDTR